MRDIYHQMTSAALHVAFLALCFAVPRASLVEPANGEVRFERWVESRIEIDDRLERIERPIEVKHSEELGFGSGVGSTGGSGAGPAWGGGVDRVAKAPALGPSSRSTSPERVERTQPESEGLAMAGKDGDDAITSERTLGLSTDGADGGGGRGEAEQVDPASGEGFAGSGSGCGCSGPAAGMRLGSIGSLGARGRDARMVKSAFGDDDKAEFIVPSVSATEPAISCDGCADIIERVIRAHLREIRYCYELSLERDPRLAGELVLSLSIPKRGGRPSAVEASSPMSDRSLKGCAEDRMSRWIFPALSNDARANFPVRLSSTTGP